MRGTGSIYRDAIALRAIFGICPHNPSLGFLNKENWTGSLQKRTAATFAGPRFPLGRPKAGGLSLLAVRYPSFRGACTHLGPDAISFTVHRRRRIEGGGGGGGGRTAASACLVLSSALVLLQRGGDNADRSGGGGAMARAVGRREAS
jgi:hypothetical protein